jgi:hypothetical protein
MRHSPGKLLVEEALDSAGRVKLELNIPPHLAMADICGREASLTADEWETVKANAARLAHCWNTHDELVRACKAALTKLESLNEEHNRTGVMLEEVLAKEAL